jgi:hypothetical protein
LSGAVARLESRSSRRRIPPTRQPVDAARGAQFGRGGGRGPRGLQSRRSSRPRRENNRAEAHRAPRRGARRSGAGTRPAPRAPPIADTSGRLANGVGLRACVEPGGVERARRRRRGMSSACPPSPSALATARRSGWYRDGAPKMAGQPSRCPAGRPARRWR